MHCIPPKVQDSIIHPWDFKKCLWLGKVKCAYLWEFVWWLLLAGVESKNLEKSDLAYEVQLVVKSTYVS